MTTAQLAAMDTHEIIAHLAALGDHLMQAIAELSAKLNEATKE